MKQLALLTNSCPAQYTCPCILPFIPLLTERVEMPSPSLSGTRTMPLSLRPPPPSLSDPLSLRDYTTRFCAFVRVYGDKSERGLRTNGLRGRQAATVPRATAASFPTGRPRPPTARPSASARIRFRPPLPLCRARRPFSALNRLPSLAPVPPSLCTGPHNGVALRGGNSMCFLLSMLLKALLHISYTNGSV